MYHYFDTLTNTRGDSLVGYRARLRQYATPPGPVVPIYADDNGTPIAQVSGLTNAVETNSRGYFGFWVPEGTYYLEVLDPGGTPSIEPIALTLAAGGGGGAPTDDEGIWNPNAEMIDNEGIWSV